MIRLLLATILAITLSIGLNQVAFAVCGGATPVFFCNDSPPNPDPTGIQEGGNATDLSVNVTPGAAVDTRLANGGNGGTAINTGSGQDQVDADGGQLDGEVDGINTGANIDVVMVKDSTVTGLDNGIDTSSNKDTVVVENSTVTGGSDAISTSSNMDNVTVKDSTVTSQTGVAIDTSSNMDQVTVINSVVTGPSRSIDTSSNTDTITLGTGADLRGLIDCGPGFDTMIFTMDVPEEAVGAISSQIIQAGLPDGSITINGLFYEWIECELLVPQLNGVRVVRPIPTLSEWALIALAGILGVVSFVAIERRRATA